MHRAHINPEVEQNPDNYKAPTQIELHANCLSHILIMLSQALESW